MPRLRPTARDPLGCPHQPRGRETLYQAMATGLAPSATRVSCCGFVRRGTRLLREPANGARFLSALVCNLGQKPLTTPTHHSPKNPLGHRQPPCATATASPSPPVVASVCVWLHGLQRVRCALKLAHMHPLPLPVVSWAATFCSPASSISNAVLSSPRVLPCPRLEVARNRMVTAT